MVDDISDVLAHSKTLVIGNGDPEFATVFKDLRDDQVMIDLVRVSESRSVAGTYEGICW